MVVGIYVRISKDITGQGLGVERQRSDCVALCVRKGWAYVVYSDNDLSAYSGRVRPAYRQMLLDLKEGRIGEVVCWHPDRLHRHPKELEEFIDVLEACSATVTTVTAGDFDLANPDGRLVARIVGSVARKESEDKSRRLRRKAKSLAEEGKVGNGGRFRPFGYEDNRLDVVEDEADRIQQAVAHVLSGGSLYSLTQRWAKEGVVTPAGNPWTPQALRTVLCSGRIAGKRQHHGEDVAVAEWPAIISADESERLRTRLRSRTTTLKKDRYARKYLLTGFLFCGLCDRKLIARRRSDGAPSYMCVKSDITGSCGGVRVVATPLEALVVDAFFALCANTSRLQKLLRQRGTPDQSKILNEVARDEAQLEELAVAYGARAVTLKEWLAAKKPIEERLRASRQELTVAEASADLGGIDLRTVESYWADLELEQRRLLLGLALDRLFIDPSGKGRPFSPDRVRPVWRA